MYEAALPRFAHNSLGSKAKSRYRQIDPLNKVRRRSLCLKLLALIRELLSQQDFYWVMQFGGRMASQLPRNFFGLTPIRVAGTLRSWTLTASAWIGERAERIPLFLANLRGA
jgi:hypothetical protein